MEENQPVSFPKPKEKAREEMEQEEENREVNVTMNVKPFASGQVGINPDSRKEPHVKVKTRRRIICTCIKRPMEGADDLTRGSQSFICQASEAGKLISQGQHVGKIIRE